MAIDAGNDRGSKQLVVFSRSAGWPDVSERENNLPIQLMLNNREFTRTSDYCGTLTVAGYDT